MIILAVIIVGIAFVAVIQDRRDEQKLWDEHYKKMDKMADDFARQCTKIEGNQ